MLLDNRDRAMNLICRDLLANGVINHHEAIGYAELGIITKEISK
jgi:hypothetical protein